MLKEKMMLWEQWNTYTDSINNNVTLTDEELLFFKISAYIHITNLMGSIMKHHKSDYDLARIPISSQISDLFCLLCVDFNLTEHQKESLAFFLDKNNSTMGRHHAAHDIFTSSQRVKHILHTDIISRSKIIYNIIEDLNEKILKQNNA